MGRSTLEMGTRLISVPAPGDTGGPWGASSAYKTQLHLLPAYKEYRHHCHPVSVPPLSVQPVFSLQPVPGRTRSDCSDPGDIADTARWDLRNINCTIYNNDCFVIVVYIRAE